MDFFYYFKHLNELKIRVILKEGHISLFGVHMSGLIKLIDKDAQRIGCQLALG